MEKWDGNEGTSAFHMPEWMEYKPGKSMKNPKLNN